MTEFENFLVIDALPSTVNLSVWSR